MKSNLNVKAEKVTQHLLQVVLVRGANRAGTVVPRGVRGHRDCRGRRGRGRGRPRAEGAEEVGAQPRPRQKNRGIIAANDEQVRN